MNRDVLLRDSTLLLSNLPTEKINQVYLYINSISDTQLEEKKIQAGILSHLQNSKSFDFLKDEEDLYTESDLKEVYK